MASRQQWLGVVLQGNIRVELAPFQTHVGSTRRRRLRCLCFLSLQVLPQQERVSMCQELTEQTLRCVRDQNGNHVVQVGGAGVQSAWW